MNNIMYLLYNPPINPSDRMTWVEVRDNDFISGSQVVFSLKRHKIDGGGVGPDHMHSCSLIAAWDSAERIAKILAIEAPPKRFSIYISGQRKWSEVDLPWSKVQSVAELDRLYPSYKVQTKI